MVYFPSFSVLLALCTAETGNLLDQLCPDTGKMLFKFLPFATVPLSFKASIGKSGSGPDDTLIENVISYFSPGLPVFTLLAAALNSLTISALLGWVEPPPEGLVVEGFVVVGFVVAGFVVVGFVVVLDDPPPEGFVVVGFVVEPLPEPEGLVALGEEPDGLAAVVAPDAPPAGLVAVPAPAALPPVADEPVPPEVFALPASPAF